MTRLATAVAALVAIAGVAAADDERAALRDVLGEAPVIVRGAATEHGFAVAEVLRGDVPGEIAVRQPDGEDPLAPGEDVILLLDAKAADGAYPLHHPVGRYRVETGELVVVNASGVDGATLSAKDLRPRAPDERISLDEFRALAGVAVKPPPPALASPPARAARAARAAPSPAPAEPPEPPAPAGRWPWLAGAVALLAVLLYVARRARAA